MVIYEVLVAWVVSVRECMVICILLVVWVVWVCGCMYVGGMGVCDVVVGVVWV